MRSLIRSNPDVLICAVYLILLIVGIWYGFPNVKIVADEAPFVGGVLRALEAKTILPHIDYSYTVSFYANYILMSLYMVVTLLVLGGDVGSLTHFLMEHVYVAYFVPRMVSILSAVLILYFFLTWLKEKHVQLRDRLVISSIVFGNILFFVIAHTGKMWFLSLLLWFMSFYSFDKALKQKDDSKKMYYSPFFWTPILSFLGFANFPINIIALLFVGWLWVEVFKNRMHAKPLLWGTLSGIFVFCLLFGLNHSGWLIQNSITPVESRSVTGLLSYFMYGAILLMPLQIIYVVWCTRPRFTYPVLALLMSLVGYIGLVAWRASWIGTLSPGYWRYFVYPIFIGGLIMAEFEIKRRYMAFILAGVALCFCLRVDYLLAIPTTYNQTRDYVVLNSSSQLVVNTSPYLDLPKNKYSYELTDNLFCQSRCLYGRASEARNAGLFVIDPETKKEKFEQLVTEATSSLVVSREVESGLLIKDFNNGLSGDSFKDIDHGLGPYSFDIFGVSRLGPHFYVYSRSSD